MSLQKCLECKKKVSSSAERCPHCGAVTKLASNASAFAFVFGGVVILWFVIQFLSMK